MSRPSTRRFLRDNSLAPVFGLLFLIALAGQAIAGHADFNSQQTTDGPPPISIGRYLTSADFAVDVAETWQSEYLQFFLYLVLTVWLLHRGSPESKSLDNPGRESDQDQHVGRIRATGLADMCTRRRLATGPVVQFPRPGHGPDLRTVLARAICGRRQRIQRMTAQPTPATGHMGPVSDRARFFGIEPCRTGNRNYSRWRL